MKTIPMRGWPKFVRIKAVVSVVAYREALRLPSVFVVC